MTSRPRIHFTAASGWINDPHGLSVVDDRYHLFFQHVPGSTTWAPQCRWGHAVSDDLVHWSEHPIALEPGDGDDGVWSGSIARDDDQGARAYYTSVQVPDFGIGRVRVARPADPQWRRWVKEEIVVGLPPELDAIAFRDPFVFRDAGCWRMLIGVALSNGTAAATSFSSPDGHAWTYDGIAASRSSALTEPVWTGSLWECPQLFTVDGQDVLVTSIWDNDVLHYVAYATGRWENGRFRPDTWRRLTYGESYYAPSFFRDRLGRPCLIFWLRGALDEQAGWAGAHSVPYLLSMVDGELVMRVHPGVETQVKAWEPDGDGIAPLLTQWRPADGDLRISDGTGATTLLHRDSGGIRVQQGDQAPVTVPVAPGAAVTLIVDGPIVEVCCGSCGYALASGADLDVQVLDPETPAAP
ncbi:glycoside hydrolase family 32 protein [Actinomyces slackii]|uniref:beta-fructofuranosidase n=1 Tax=Actinomyces slackii TaxID=52774 RepID=A0A448KE49_9ACTO|nr:glycoside hydrolase family 32 protein [Actinomyces slackii]VEG75182.1 Beta-fructosidase [Actinomyces slackii]